MLENVINKLNNMGNPDMNRETDRMSAQMLDNLAKFDAEMNESMAQFNRSNREFEHQHQVAMDMHQNMMNQMQNDGFNEMINNLGIM